MKAKYRNLWEGRYIKISKSLWFFTHLQSVHHRACRLVRGLRKGLSWPKPEVSGNNNLFGKGTQPHPKPVYWEKKKNFFLICVQFSHSVVSDSLRPHELQHASPPCPPPTPGVHPKLCPLSRWCHPAISSSVVPFSSCPNPSQHQSLFQWGNSSHKVAKVLEFQL